MLESYFSPSQAYDRFEQLRKKMEFEDLNERESKEYERLQEILPEVSGDDFMDY